MLNKTCKYCQRDFDTKTKKQRFCSPECSKKYMAVNKIGFFAGSRWKGGEDRSNYLTPVGEKEQHDTK